GATRPLDGGGDPGARCDGHAGTGSPRGQCRGPLRGEPNLAQVNAAIRRRAEEWGHPHDRSGAGLSSSACSIVSYDSRNAPAWGLAGGQSLLLTIQSHAGGWSAGPTRRGFTLNSPEG